MALTSRDLISTAYETGVTMGGTLHVDADRRPTFSTWAVQDPNTAKLQRVQIIKGWLQDGEHREQIYDVACSDSLSVDTNTHRCPDNGAKVNLDDCSRTANVGASELRTLWQDPDFVPGQEAFYYVRVLKTRCAAGRRGMLFDLENNLARIYQRLSKSEPGLRLFGTANLPMTIISH